MPSEYQKRELHRTYFQEIMELPKIIDTQRRAFLCHVFRLALASDQNDLYDNHYDSLRKELNRIETGTQNTLYEFYGMYDSIREDGGE